MDLLSADAVWPQGRGAALKLARESAGLSQGACAEVLAELGALPSPDQSSVSNWEGGTRPRTASRRAAVSRFLALHLPSGDKEGPTNTRPTDPTFEDVVRPLTKERAVTDAQAAVRDAIQQRFRDGPPMTPDDGAVFRWLVEFHHLQVDAD